MNEEEEELGLMKENLLVDRCQRHARTTRFTAHVTLCSQQQRRKRDTIREAGMLSVENVMQPNNNIAWKRWGQAMLLV